jgi:uncharacterized protein YegL
MNSCCNFNFFNKETNIIPSLDSFNYLSVFSNEFYPLKNPNNDKILYLETNTAYVASDFSYFFPKDQDQDQDQENLPTQNKSVYLGCQLSSKFDGIGNRSLPIDLVILLDVSGSMSDTLGDSTQRCIDLAKSAIIKLKLKLKENDRIALVTFDDQAKIIFDLNYLKNISNFDNQVSDIALGGSTIISVGMDKCFEVMTEQNKILHENRLRRILLLTDMNDTEGNDELVHAVQKCSKNNIFISIIGIGFDLNFSLTEKISKTKGFNYFSAIKEEHLDEIIVKNFDLNFFPIAYDINLTLESGDLKIEKVYGTNFDNKLLQLEQEWKTSEHILTNIKVKNNAEFLLLLYQRMKNRNLPMPILKNYIQFLQYNKKTKNVCEISSCTATEKQQNHVKGKFFMIKCSLMNFNKKFYSETKVTAKLNLSYNNLQNEFFSEEYYVSIKLPKNDEFFVSENIKIGLSNFYIAKFMRKMIRAYENLHDEKNENFLKEENLILCRKNLEKVLNYLNQNKNENSNINQDFVSQLLLKINKLILDISENKNDKENRFKDNSPRRRFNLNKFSHDSDYEI